MAHAKTSFAVCKISLLIICFRMFAILLGPRDYVGGKMQIDSSVRLLPGLQGFMLRGKMQSVKCAV